MGINLESNQAEIRETRLSSVTAYYGDAVGLCGKSRQGRLCERNRSFGQSVSCGSINAICKVCLIQDAVVINHAPVGCANDLQQFNFINRNGQARRSLDLRNIRVINTNLEEKDMVYGGLPKLENAIREAKKRHNPKAIFVTTSCASGIIGDDIQSSTDKLEKEIGIPVAPVFCEGFRSKVWASGFDAAYHAILTKIVKPAKQKTNNINVINFWGSDIFTDLFGRLGLAPNYIVPFTTIETLERLSESLATVQVCATLGTYLAAGLEQKFGVPELKAPPPYGIIASDIWFRELGRITGKEKEVEELIRTEKERVLPRLEELKLKLRDKTVFVAAGGIHGHSIIYILKELGMNVTGGTVWHHDQKFDNDDERSDSLAHLVKYYENVPLSVSNKQAFELVNILNRLRPDIYISRHPGMSVWGAKLGIPTFLMGDEQFGVGYRGIINYGEKILDTLTNPSFAKNMSKYSKLPFTNWWLEQEPFSFIEGDEL